MLWRRTRLTEANTRAVEFEMRITQVIAGLGGGGAERVCVNLANAWAERGWKVTILTVSQGRAPRSYAIDSGVQLQDIRWPRRADPKELNRDLLAPILSGLHGVACFEIVHEAALLSILRHTILSIAPTVVVAHIDYTNVRVLAAMHQAGIPVIACEHTDTRQFTIGAWQYTREALYRRASAVVASHAAVAQWLRTRGARAYAIPNPLKTPPRNGVEKTGRRHLVALTRLSPEKRPDLMIRAFASIAADFPDWDFEIYGAGEMQSWLETLIEQLLPCRIQLCGFTNDPYSMLARSDLFVSASWLEGFGNAIWEALACGVPVVAMEAGAPVRSLVRDGIDGLIVSTNSTEALANALASLMHDEERRKAFALRAPEVMTRFSYESSLQAWDALLDTVAAVSTVMR